MEEQGTDQIFRTGPADLHQGQVIMTFSNSYGKNRHQLELKVTTLLGAFPHNTTALQQHRRISEQVMCKLGPPSGEYEVVCQDHRDP
eukprot:XP_012809216.1 PREDICTED: uncharacterized protein b3gnt3 isoform X2 [Xenopus tropicalis]